jgi:hypothetical protein
MARAQEADVRVEQGEIASTAGTAGDPVRAVETLAGFSPPAAGRTTPAFHGSDDVRFRLEGVELPFPMHPSGQRGVVAPSFVTGVEVHDGAPLAHGGTSASVDLLLRPPSSDRPHVSAALDPLGATVAAETPVGAGGRGTAVGLVLRRSVLEAWGPANPAEPAPASLVAGPVYDSPVPASAGAVFAETPAMWDGLLLATTRVGPDDRALVSVHGASDDVRLRLDRPVDSDPALRGPASASASSLVGLVRWDHAGATHGGLVASFATISDGLRVGDSLRVDRAHGEARLRAEGSRALDELFELRAGAEVAASRTELRVVGPPPSSEGLPRTPVSIGPALRGQTETLALAPAVWASTPVRPDEAVRVEPGIRVAHLPTATARPWAMDPRLFLHARLAPGTTVRGRVGIWSDGPPFFATLPALGGGTQDVGPSHVSQVAGSVDRTWDPLVVGLEAWLSSSSGLLVATPDETARGVHLASSGSGVGRGVEVAIAAPASETGWARASYAISETERTDPVARSSPAPTDRTHVATAAGALRLSEGWILGARLRVSSGAPVPVAGAAVWDANADAFQVGAAGVERLPFFHQLDLRVEKGWSAGGARLSLWLDVQNAYAARTVVDRVCSFDGGSCANVYGLPFFPQVGLGGRL